MPHYSSKVKSINRTYRCPFCALIDIKAKNSYRWLKAIIKHLERHAQELKYIQVKYESLLAPIEEATTANQKDFDKLLEKSMETYDPILKKLDDTMSVAVEENHELTPTNSMKAALKSINAELKIYPNDYEKSPHPGHCEQCGFNFFEECKNVDGGVVYTCKGCRLVQ